MPLQYKCAPNNKTNLVYTTEKLADLNLTCATSTSQNSCFEPGNYSRWAFNRGLASLTIGTYKNKTVGDNIFDSEQPTPTTYSIVANNACSSKNCGESKGDDGYAGFAIAAAAYNQSKGTFESGVTPGLFYDPIISQGKGTPFGSYGASSAKDYAVTAVSWIVPYRENGQLDTGPIYENSTIWYLIGSSNGVVYLCYNSLLDPTTTYIDPYCTEEITSSPQGDSGGGYTNGGIVEMLYLPKNNFLIIMDYALNFFFFNVTFDIPNSPQPTITYVSENTDYSLGSDFSGTSSTYQNGYKWLPRVSFQPLH